MEGGNKEGRGSAPTLRIPQVLEHALARGTITGLHGLDCEVTRVTRHAGSVVLTTPVHGVAAMREVVLGKAAATKSSATSSFFGLGKASLVAGTGTLTAAALTVAFLVPSGDEALGQPDGLLTNSHTVSLAGQALDENEDTSHSWRGIASHGNIVSSAPRAV